MDTGQTTCPVKSWSVDADVEQSSGVSDLALAFEDMRSRLPSITGMRQGVRSFASRSFAAFDAAADRALAGHAVSIAKKQGALDVRPPGHQKKRVHRVPPLKK